MVVEQLQTPQDLLGTPANERCDVVRREKAMPLNEPNDLVVALIQLNRTSSANATKAGKTIFLHSSILPPNDGAREKAKYALSGKFRIIPLSDDRAHPAAQFAFNFCPRHGESLPRQRDEPFLPSRMVLERRHHLRPERLLV